MYDQEVLFSKDGKRLFRWEFSLEVPDAEAFDRGVLAAIAAFRKHVSNAIILRDRVEIHVRPDQQRQVGERAS